MPVLGATIVVVNSAVVVIVKVETANTVEVKTGAGNTVVLVIVAGLFSDATPLLPVRLGLQQATIVLFQSSVLDSRRKQVDLKLRTQE